MLVSAGPHYDIFSWLKLDKNDSLNAGSYTGLPQIIKTKDLFIWK